MKVDLDELEKRGWSNLRNTMRLLDAIETVKMFLPSEKPEPEAPKKLLPKTQNKELPASAPIVGISGVSQIDLVTQILGDRKMTITEIADAMTAMGWKFSAKDPVKAVGMSLFYLRRKGTDIVEAGKRGRQNVYKIKNAKHIMKVSAHS